MADVNKKTALSNDELDGVFGGQGSSFGRSCAVTGPYWDTSAGEGPGKTDLIGKPNVTVEYVSYEPGRCKYHLFQNGVAKGWTVLGNFKHI